MQTPAAKYDQISGLNHTRPRAFQLKIMPSKDKGEPIKIKKSKDPDVGTYNHSDAYKKTQLHHYEKNQFMPKGPKKNFLDDAVKTRKFVPPPGHYKEVEKCYSRLSTSPMSLRTRRH